MPLDLPSLLQSALAMNRMAPANVMPMPPPQLAPVHTLPGVIAHMGAAWGAAKAGANNREAGFQVLDDGTIIPHAFDNQTGQIAWNPRPNTMSEFHVHPASSDPQPSTNDQAVANKYKFNIYTFGNRGLYRYDWQTKKTTQVKGGMDWAK